MPTPNAALLRLLLIASLFALAACEKGGDAGGDGDASAEEAEDEAPPVPVEVRVANRADVFAIYTGTASLESDEDALVVAKVGGEVEQLFVEEGDRVKAGQVLARLDGDRLRLEMEQARANLRKLQQDYERNIELHEKGLVSAGAFENLKFDLDSQQAAYDLAKLELDYTEIRAPISGIVSDRFIKVGNTIAVSDPVFHITDLDPLLAYLFVPEREFRKLRAGQAADVTLDAIPGETYKAEILRISPVLDPQTGTFKVTLAVADSEDRLKPGMFGRFQIVYDRRENAIMVPRMAIIDDDDKSTVYVVEEGTAQRRDVRTGYSRGENVEILEGVEGGELVITIGQAGIADGATVDVIGADGDAVVEVANPDVSVAGESGG